MFTVEDYLEILVGLKEHYSFKIASSDQTILRSIGRQVFRGTALTDRQYEVVKNKLNEYKDQFISFDFKNFDDVLNNLRMPLRQINRSKYIKVVDTIEVAKNNPYEAYKENWQWIKIRFPFSKKLILLLDSIPTKGKFNYHHEKGSHTHYFKLTEQSVFEIVEKFQNKEFEIDQILLDLHKDIMEIMNNRKQHVPGIYNLKLKNLNQKAIDVMISAVGEPSIETLALYKDREDLFGLHHFDQSELDDSIFRLTPLSQKIVRRTEHNVLVNSSIYTFNNLAESLLELNRFPLLVCLNENSALDQLHTVHQAFRGFIENTESTVLFRLDNETNSDFNNYVKKNNLNSTLDKNTKIVYINVNKVPKPLLQSGWQAQAMLLMSSIRLSNKTAPMANQLDLIIHYDTDISQFTRLGSGIQKL